MGDTDANNSRVTLAVLGEKIDNLTEKVEDSITDGKALEGSVQKVQISQAAQRVEINTLTESQKELRKNSNRNDGIVGGVMLGVITVKEIITEIFK